MANTIIIKNKDFRKIYESLEEYYPPHIPKYIIDNFIDFFSFLDMLTVTKANHPGVLLDRWLKDKAISQRKFAIIIGKSYVDINNIIHGKKDINVDFAIRIGLALHTSPDVWLDMQKNYDLYKTKLSEKRHEYSLISQRVKNFMVPTK